MDKSLYLSYECFKNLPDYGIVVTLKTGDELFYQVMADSHLVMRHRWPDTQLVCSINKDDIISHVNVAQYMQDKKLQYSLNDPSLFLLLTKDYLLMPSIMDKIQRELNMSDNVLVSKNIYSTIKC